MLLLTPGCATTNQPLVLAAVKCGTYIPETYRQPVPGVTPLAKGSTVGDLGTKLDRQTNNLDQANGRTGDLVALVDSCDTRNQQIIKTLVPDKPFWKFW